MRQKDLTEEFEFVKRNKKTLLEQYMNQYLLIYQQQVINAFDSYESAFREGVKKFGIDKNFLVFHHSNLEPLHIIYSARV